jgi:undecaprenyl-diphosphatase
VLLAFFSAVVRAGPDEAVFRMLNLAGSNAILDVFMVGISALALAYVLPLIAIPLWTSGRREVAVDALVLLALAIAATEALKFLTAKSRPCEIPGLAVVIAPEFCPGSLDAFPSGHSSRAFALATLLATRMRPRVGATSLVLAGLVGLSRIYVGAHWPSDVLAGAVLGIGLGLAWWAFEKRSARYRAFRGRLIASVRGRRPDTPRH